MPRTWVPSKGDLTGPGPVDRGRLGSRHHLITDAAGIPLAVIVTGGHRNDVTQLLPLLDAIPPIRGRRGRPRRLPGKVYADRGYDHDKYRRLRTRYERCADTHQAMISFACSIICLRNLQPSR